MCKHQCSDITRVMYHIIWYHFTAITFSNRGAGENKMAGIAQLLLPHKHAHVQPVTY